MKILRPNPRPLPLQGRGVRRKKNSISISDTPSLQGKGLGVRSMVPDALSLLVGTATD
jgi:hypothetical protein